jgi:rod shape determining protein RodA
MWMMTGIFIIMVIVKIDYKLFEKLAYPILVFSLVVLLLVLVAGREVKGARRWLQLGFFNIQPSEMVKISVVLAYAKYFSSEKSWPIGGYTLRGLIKPASILYPVGALGGLILFWDKFPQGWGFVAMGVFLVWAAASFLFLLRSGSTSLHDILTPVILVALPALLILKQPDLGTTLVLFAISGTMILFVRIKTLSLIILAIALIGVFVTSWTYLLKPYQKDRVTAFLSPDKDTLDTGYHAKQSMIAVGSGGVSGKGFGKSTQTEFHFLPEQHTDFVFSVWAEEWGFWGSLAILGLFLFWMAQMVNIASLASDKFAILVAVGITAKFFWHTIINIGMVIGLMPVVGSTLPLWSYGGSSMITSMIGIGLLASISYRRYKL